MAHLARRAGPVAIVAGLLAAPLAWLTMPAPKGAAQAAPDPLVDIQMSDTTELTDGQTLEVVVTPREGVRLVGGGDMTFCRNGESYGNALDGSILVDFDPFRGGKCQSSDTLSPLASFRGDLHVFPDGRARGSINAGIGTTLPWRTQGGGEATLTCDPDTPCRLVIAFSYRVGDGPVSQALDASTLLTYRDQEGTLAGCQGNVDGSLRTVGADRVGAAWEAWTISQCRDGATGGLALTSGVFSDERSGLEDFASGGADLAYSAIGYPSPMADPPTDRPYVATPVAVNAVVLAVAGGFESNAADWVPQVPRPFSDLRLTIDEAAALVGQGPFGLDTDGVAERNPQFAALASVVRVREPPLIPGTPDARALFASTAFDGLAPEAWRDFAAFGGEERGVTADFGTSDPSFEPAISQRYTNVTSLERSVFGLNLRTPADRFGATWALTDYSTALRLGMTPVAIQFQEGGEFVTPTPESIAAGLAVMTPQADGTLVPDPTQAAPSAYPLTMVEYAFAPADGLGARCATLVGWLEHVTGAGQQHLPEGLVSLAAAGLDDEAGQAVAQLAAAPTCGEAAGPGGPSGGAGPPSTPSSGAPPGTGGGFGDAGSGLGGPDGGFDGGSADATSLVGGASAAPDSSREAAADEAAEAAAEAEIEMPPFGIVGFERFGPPTAVLLVVFATSVAALVSSGRPLPAAVTAVPTLARRAGRAAQRTLHLPLRART